MDDLIGLLTDRSHLARRRFAKWALPAAAIAFKSRLDLKRQGYYHAGKLHGVAVPAIHLGAGEDFFARLTADGILGFGEAFMNKSWSGVPEPSMATLEHETDTVVSWLSVTASHLARRPRSRIASIFNRFRMALLPSSPTNSPSGSRQNVAAHYDLPVDFFRIFLDPSLTYSSGDFTRTKVLEEAQLQKSLSILEMAGVGPGSKVLDIGCGWGGMLIDAARLGSAQVVGLTLSHSQALVASERAAASGYSGVVDIREEDYREHRGRYSSIVSVEMLEAVGRQHWRDYFAQVDRLLAPDGNFALQTITFPHDRMRAELNNYSWTDRYIFPGGELCSIAEIDGILRTSTGLEIVTIRCLSASYARTLREWRHRFCRNIAAVVELGFDEFFCRVWALYFAYFEAGFASRYLDVYQLHIRRVQP